MTAIKKTQTSKQHHGEFHSSEKENRIVVYRNYFEKLLAAPKSLRDQLLVELPILEALRTGEVSSLRVEYVNFESGDLTVLDSKKDKLTLIPLDPTVAEHLQRYIVENNLAEGYLFPARKRKVANKSKGVALTLSAIQHVWDKYCDVCAILRMSPRMGRAFFAVKWIFIEHKTIYGLMVVLRHEDPLATQKYLAKIVDYTSVKAEFQRGKASPFSPSCSRFDACPLATEECYCRMFMPNEMVKVKT